MKTQKETIEMEACGLPEIQMANGEIDKIRELKEFEEWCIDNYHKGRIRSPMHLSGGNEEQLINIFKEIRPHDWIFTTYRSHYHALLKGVDKEWLKKWILENKSIHVMNKEHQVISSAIVGGTLSQAVGTAMAIKRKYENINKDHRAIPPFEIPKVWAFCGDMTASLGIFDDCLRYSVANNLPIKFVIEDNGLSTDTPTNEAWNVEKESLEESFNNTYKNNPQFVIYYKYKRIYPHYGTNRGRVDFNKIDEKILT